MKASTIPNFISKLLPRQPVPIREPFAHCPNPNCSQAMGPTTRGKWYVRHGHYKTNMAGVLQRYICKSCKKTFSSRNFHIDYGTRIAVDYQDLLSKMVIGSGSGTCCRQLGISEKVLLDRTYRLARVFLAVHSKAREELQESCGERSFTLDGFESFSHSQYHPNNINLLIGDRYQYIYGMGLSVLKRKGRMTAFQRSKRDRMEALHPTDPKETRRSVANLLRDMILLTQGATELTLNTDMHKTYPKALSDVDPTGVHFIHKTESSRTFRNSSNILFPANYADRQIRKDQANHKRETVQFARCPQAMMGRQTLYMGFYNYLEPFRIKNYREGDLRTAAERMGLSRDRLRELFAEFWGRRPFLRNLNLWEEERKTWLFMWRNPGVKFGGKVSKALLAA